MGPAIAPDSLGREPDAELQAAMGRDVEAVGSRFGRIDDAIADLSEAIRLKPDAPIAYFSRGILYARRGDRERAAADMRKTLEINPAHEGAKQTLRMLGAQYY